MNSKQQRRNDAMLIDDKAKEVNCVDEDFDEDEEVDDRCVRCNDRRCCGQSKYCIKCIRVLLNKRRRRIIQGRKELNVYRQQARNLRRLQQELQRPKIIK